MRLDQLLADVEVSSLVGDPATDVTSVTHDSRAVAPGALFCCLPGLTADGHDHAPAAVAAGAVALLAGRRLDTVPATVAQALVADPRAAMGPAAARFWGRPSVRMAVVGVTGTNGKTTTVTMLAAIFEAAGWPSATIGTLTGARTTPEATELQPQLARFADEGIRAVAMEVSSHALAQHRVDGTRFAVGVFTNLSQDHLDYHHDMRSYFEAKAALFEEGRVGAAVVGIDDEWGRELLRRLPLRLPVRTFSLADAEDLHVGLIESAFRWHGTPVHVRLGGRHNVRNALAAAEAAAALGIAPAAVAAGLGSLAAVPGRYEPVDRGQPFAVVVDYAHTPDGIEQVLGAARGTTDGRVIVVFGAGGDRDAGKRPLMGEAAARLADLAILTSDNPRTEDPLAIIAAVRAGVSAEHAGRLVVEPDRALAIAAAIDAAGPGDVVVIAGKGHETGQTVGTQTTPFDDRAVAAEALVRRRERDGW